ncbi:hypothetical protein [Streptomyces sp. NWU339]|uniref:hypothetical protein n=1 Tax=Streptomyces sp. NWU339 TaxID=2185284 RepID=UPI0011B3F227|nr:hypothetical protein [Streptomyces sp. NWU339]
MNWRRRSAGVSQPSVCVTARPVRRVLCVEGPVEITYGRDAFVATPLPRSPQRYDADEKP